MNFARMLLSGAALGLVLGFAATAPGFAETTAPAAAPAAASIDFGDDTSDWAKDGECDDPRFTGTGVASETVAADIKKDATDCKAAVTAGKATVKAGSDAPTAEAPAAPAPVAPKPPAAPATPVAPAAPAVAKAGDVNYGDDTSQWAKDGECDDPRFAGKGSAEELDPVDASHDATDCKAAVAAGTVTFKGDTVPDTTTTTDTPTADTNTNSGNQFLDYGDDSSQWAKDGECDDPRFAGKGSAEELDPVDAKHDATDCLAAVTAGTVTFKGNAVPATTTTTTTDTPATDAPTANTNTNSGNQILDFGDDSSQWAKDGECDDPRFVGKGSAEELDPVDAKHDATDCKAAYDAGNVTLKEGGAAPGDTPVADTPTGSIQYGDDSSEWAKDGECDDPRFTGTGVSSDPSDTDIKKDAFDCKAAVDAGTATIKAGGTTPANTPPVASADVQFGDDTGQWPKDGECDDPRFVGTGAADAPEDVDSMHDATDCKTAFDAGTVTLKGGSTAPTADQPDIASIDFGDDTGQYPKDGECDDPRFVGTALADEPEAVDIKHDATDCKAAFGAGTVTIKTAGSVGNVDFGSDTSKYANDGECDDPRFTGPGTDKKLLNEDKMADATDCKKLADEGQITLRPVFDPDYAAGAPYATTGIDFGDNTSSYANDTECDDPRFEGPGLADSPVAENKWHDHDDCIAAFKNGTIALRL